MNKILITTLATVTLLSSCSWINGKDKNDLQPKLGGVARTPVNQQLSTDPHLPAIPGPGTMVNSPANPAMINPSAGNNPPAGNQPPMGNPGFMPDPQIAGNPPVAMPAQPPQPAQPEVFLNQDVGMGTAPYPTVDGVSPQNAQPLEQPAAPQAAAPQPMIAPPHPVMPAPQAPAPVAVASREPVVVATISKKKKLPASLSSDYSTPFAPDVQPAMPVANYGQPVMNQAPMGAPIQQQIAIPQMRAVNAPTQPVQQMELYTTQPPAAPAAQ